MGAGPSRAPGAGGPPGAPDRTLYVGNLPYDVTQQEIETLIAGTNAGQWHAYTSRRIPRGANVASVS